MSKREKPTGSTIVIRLNGDETTATLMGDEFQARITRTIAYRNPKDEYDAYIGARVALDRLFDKDDMFADKKPEEPKKANEPKKTESPKKVDAEFQVGDIVRVTNASLTFGRYKNGDVAVVTKVVAPPAGWLRTSYGIKVRSKERKGFEGVAFADELTLLHRPKKEGDRG